MAKPGQLAKPEQILIIEPSNELKFRGPFTSPVISYIKLTNPTDYSICFKIKTTAPKKYCVRPNSGILDPLRALDIAVILQPFDFDANDKNRHKFMVQSIKAPDTEDFNVENLWKDAAPESLMDSKLRCVFEMPMDDYVTGLTNTKEDAKKRDVYSSVTSSEPVDPEMQKATNEIARLQEELSASQRENLQLKEDIIKARRSPMHAPSTLTNVRSNQTAQAAGNQMMMPAVYVGIGVFLCLVAMFLKSMIF